MLTISLDTETTGVDLHHGARPFLVTICQQGMDPLYWEWFVNPSTRKPRVIRSELDEIQDWINRADELILQNAKFDAAALTVLFREYGVKPLKWDWDKVRDTLICGHLLASNQPHDLTSMALVYAGMNIEPLEADLVSAVNEARRIARSKYPHWKIAKRGEEGMPSAKEKVSKFDLWLPRAIAAQEKYPKDHPWWTVCSDYACGDSLTTVVLHDKQMEQVEERGLTAIYHKRLEIVPIVFKMEQVGITLSEERLDELCTKFAIESLEQGEKCVAIAKEYGYDLTLPKAATNNSLRTFAFDEQYLGLHHIKNPKGKSENPSLDKNALEEYEKVLDPGPRLEFVKALRAKRKRDTGLSYMESYRNFWVPVFIVNHKTGAGWYRLHPSLNPTGTSTLRFSSSNPNEQNISKQEGFNIRYCFGPLPGREWWSCDAKNIELRLPAYDSGEEAMIALFERPDDAPYYGSNHLLAAHLIHDNQCGCDGCYPLIAKHGVGLFEYVSRNPDGTLDGRKFKKQYASTWYQWIKNGNFAVQYGAQQSSGTADRAYHVNGAQAKMEKRLGKISALNSRMIADAERYGYVETMPDKTVDPDRGYPLLCTRTHWGGIKPTIPLSYRIQGTAMWWMMKAMIRCDMQLDDWNDLEGFDACIVMQVHDELVFDMPKSRVSPELDFKLEKLRASVGQPMVYKSNLGRIRRLQALMAQSGDDIGVPTPVSCEWHPNNWAEGMAL